MSVNQPILNLDQLTGRINPIIVERKGRRYEMVRPEGLTLKQNQEWQDTAKRLLQAYGPTAKNGTKSLDDLGRSINECLAMLCPGILDEEKQLSLIEKWKRKSNPEKYSEQLPFSFEEKVKVLEFYVQQVFPKMARNTGSRTSREDRSGAQSSPTDKTGTRKNRIGA